MMCLGVLFVCFYIKEKKVSYNFPVISRIWLVLILGSRQSEFSNSLPQNASQPPHTSQTDSLSSEDLRRRRQAYFEK